MSALYIVATPIGNLEDITIRALNILKEVDLILCEDTRVTRILLERYEIKKPTMSYHQHSKLQKIDHIIGLLKEGKNLALVSDAGTPGISDPGQRLIEKVIESCHSRGGGNPDLINADPDPRFHGDDRNNIDIIPIPGPNAAIAALSISGFPTDEFLFLGFPPHKKGRQTFFENVLIEAEKRTVVFYESTHRIIKALEQIIDCYSAKCSAMSLRGSGADEAISKKISNTRLPRSFQSLATTKNGEPRIVLCRELTKKFETIYRGTPSEVTEKLKGGIIKGEFVVVVKIL